MLTMTTNFYDENAASFFENTVNVDMSALYQRFTKHLPKGARLLDAGGGSGRDSKAFLEMGYEVDALDASPKMVEMATELTGLPVQLKLFNEIYSQEEYDGIWTCASLLHVPHAELAASLERLATALKPQGIWYVSFKYGESERFKDGRHFTDLNEGMLADLIQPLEDLELIEFWVTEDARPDRTEQWLNAILKKDSFS
ncbi:class I SAM-dependent methyltransferase [uncultured Ferrimonas sp.]|uniref:class I SAM-dependent methyltransferase n=1 Tax=uncultured Ferrimonas sp. TaxID=432640 RepID=UPI002624D2BF|nr:class I SAM-dependent methyltransferase [uncultured Ferrimonas sp.]